MTGIFRLLRGVIFGTLAAQLDPNHWERLREQPEGPALVPMAVQDGRRRSVHDYILETERAFPDYLTVWTDKLVTSVVFRDGTKAGGVRCRVPRWREAVSSACAGQRASRARRG